MKQGHPYKGSNPKLCTSSKFSKKYPNRYMPHTQTSKKDEKRATPTLECDNVPNVTKEK